MRARRARVGLLRETAKYHVEILGLCKRRGRTAHLRLSLTFKSTRITLSELLIKMNDTQTVVVENVNGGM